MADWNFCKVEDMAAASVRDNKAQNCFELDVEGAVAFANYRLAPGAVIITHTETPRATRPRHRLRPGAGRAAIDPRRSIEGRRRLRLRGGLPAQASGVCGSGGMNSTSSPQTPVVPAKSGDPYSVTLV